MPLISVIIATFNRQDLLNDTLRNLGDQQCDGLFSYEVVVADNNSSDRTAAFVQSLIPNYSAPLKYVFEPRQGKSFALNCGLTAAGGDIIVFTDDDCRLAPDWLKTIHQTFLHFDADGVGGRVLPLWVGERPLWMTEKIERQLGVADHGDSAFVLPDMTASFIGPCMAYKRTVIDTVGGFDERRLKCSEDVDLFRRIFAAGFKLVYQPQIVVFNKLDAKRFSKRAIGRRFFLQGRACALGAQEDERGRTICRIPLWVIRRFLALHFEALRAYLKGDKDEALWCWLERHIYRGTMWFCFKDWLANAPIRKDSKP